MNVFIRCPSCKEAFYLPLAKGRGPEKECACQFRKKEHLHLFCACGKHWLIDDPRVPGTLSA